MQKKYKKLLFDLDNTLIDDDENRKYAIKQILMERKEEPTNKRINDFIRIDNKLWKDRAEGKLEVPNKYKSKEGKAIWLRTRRFLSFFENISFDEAYKINNEYINYLSKKIIPMNNANETIKYLYEKGYEIYILTNGPSQAVGNKIKSVSIGQYLTGVFTAEEAGYMKPHQEFFDKFFNKINNYETDDMLIIGDELEKDIAGGNQNNMDSCWFNLRNTRNDTNYTPTYEIKNLIELEKIL